MRESMEEELKEKDRQLQDLLAKHQEVFNTAVLQLLIEHDSHRYICEAKKMVHVLIQNWIELL